MAAITPMDGALVGTSLIKQLAFCNKSIRDRSLRRIINTWIPSQHQISDDDMKKLWKGLFYCVWHADKAPVQAELIERLSSLLPELPVAVALHYFSVFLLTMCREWPGIDHLRLDKFYLLIRRFVFHFFALLKKNSWDLELCCRCMNVLEENLFFVDDKLQANGVKYHVASIFLEELKTFFPVKKEVIEVLLGRFILFMEKSPNKLLATKIKSNVFDSLLKMGEGLLEAKNSGDVDLDSEDNKDMVILGAIALTMGFSAKFYGKGSSVDCYQGNRRILFGLYEKFFKLEKDMVSSNIEVLFPVVDNADTEQIPTLVPFAIDMEMDKSDVNSDPIENADNVCIGKAMKKCGETKKGSDGSGKKAKNKKKRKRSSSDIDEVNFLTNEANESVDIVDRSNESLVQFDESMMSNLQMQFEIVASEMGLGDNGVASACNLQRLSVNGTAPKKRKRSKGAEAKQKTKSNGQMDYKGAASASGKDNGIADLQTLSVNGPPRKKMKRSNGTEMKQKTKSNSPLDSGSKGSASANGKDTSSKKVSFSMKNNLVWKPHSPLPPQSVRIPPSLTPRGSALKKGVPPGPVRDVSHVGKRRVKSLNKTRNTKRTAYHTKKRNTRSY